MASIKFCWQPFCNSKLSPIWPNASINLNYIWSKYSKWRWEMSQNLSPIWNTFQVKFQKNHWNIKEMPSPNKLRRSMGTEILDIFWHSIWHFIWHSLWHSMWLCLWSLLSDWSPARPTAFRLRLKSGEAHSTQTLAGWSPARPTALRLSPVEVRRGPQCSDSRRLKSGETLTWQVGK